MKALIAVFVLVLLLSGCGSKKSVILKSLKESKKIAFVEYYQISEATVIEGSINSRRRIDSPTYHYNNESGTIESYRSLSFSPDTIILVLGTGRILNGAAGTGVSSLLLGASKLPLSYGELKIISTSKKSINVEFKGEKITISTNSKWEKITEYNDTINDQKAIIKMIVTERISFHGFMSSDSLKN